MIVLVLVLVAVLDGLGEDADDHEDEDGDEHEDGARLPIGTPLGSGSVKILNDRMPFTGDERQISLEEVVSAAVASVHEAPAPLCGRCESAIARRDVVDQQRACLNERRQ